MYMKINWTLVGEDIMQYTGDILQNCLSETYIILLSKVTAINSIKNTEK